MSSASRTRDTWSPVLQSPLEAASASTYTEYYNAEGKFIWTWIFRWLPFSQTLPGRQKDAKIWHNLWITEDIFSLVGNYNPLSSPSPLSFAEFLTFGLFPALYLFLFILLLPGLHLPFYPTPYFALTLHLTPSCHCPHSVLDPGCFLLSPVCQASSCREHQKHRRGNSIISILELIMCRAPEGATTTGESLCSKILCTE